jgi:hypothetical protein
MGGETTSTPPAGETPKKIVAPKGTKQWPIDLFQCKKGDSTNTPETFCEEDYEFIANEVISAYESQHAQDPETTARFGACLVRFTGHDFMDFR